MQVAVEIICDAFWIVWSNWRLLSRILKSLFLKDSNFFLSIKYTRNHFFWLIAKFFQAFSCNPSSLFTSQMRIFLKWEIWICHWNNFIWKNKENKDVHSTVKNHSYFKPLLKDILFLTTETVLPVSSEMLNYLLKDIMVSLRKGLKGIWSFFTAKCTSLFPFLSPSGISLFLIWNGERELYFFLY